MKRINALLMNAAMLGMLSFGIPMTAAADCERGQCPRTAECCKTADCCKDGKCSRQGECCKAGECTKAGCCNKQKN